MPRTIKFIDTVIRNIGTPDKRTVYWCEGSPSLGLRITPSGIKSFIFKYKAAGVSRWITIGRYPALSIREARAKYNEHYEAVHDYQKDIVAEEKAKIELENSRITVSELIASYEEIELLRGKKSIKAEISTFQSNVIPVIGDIYVKDVTSDDIDKIQLRILNRAKHKNRATSNGRVAVKNTLAYTRHLFNFAKTTKALRKILKEHHWINPVLEVNSLGESAVRDRVLSFKELWLFWNRIENVGLPPVTAKTLKFALASMQRSKEIRHLTYSALKTEENVWEMTRSDTKNKQMHRVPLNNYSNRLIDEVSAYTKNSSFVFGVTRETTPPKEPRSDLKPFTVSALSKALYRKRTTIGVENITPHDLRRTGATWITAVGLPKLYARLLLNHSDGDKSATAVYVQYGYDFEKVKAVKVWEFVLDQIVQCPTVDDTPTLEEVREAVQKSGLL